MSDNRLEYLGIVLGLNKLGTISALLNFKLRKDSLRHVINVGHCKSIICLSEFVPAVLELEDLPPDFKIYELKSEDPDLPSHYPDGFNPENSIAYSKMVIDLNTELSKVSCKSEFSAYIQDTNDEISSYMYTSGSTGSVFLGSEKLKNYGLRVINLCYYWVFCTKKVRFPVFFRRK